MPRAFRAPSLVVMSGLLPAGPTRAERPCDHEVRQEDQRIETDDEQQTVDGRQEATVHLTLPPAYRMRLNFGGQDS
ncbi:hypothetical protein GCM10028864_65560 [Microlunatus parietis]